MHIVVGAITFLRRNLSGPYAPKTIVMGRFMNGKFETIWLQHSASCDSMHRKRAKAQQLKNKGNRKKIDTKKARICSASAVHDS